MRMLWEEGRKEGKQEGSDTGVVVKDLRVRVFRFVRIGRWDIYIYRLITLRDRKHKDRLSRTRRWQTSWGKLVSTG